MNSTRNYKEFIQLLFSISKKNPLLDYNYGPSNYGTQVTVIFKDNSKMQFESTHMLWFEDFQRVIFKIKRNEKNRSMQKMSDKTDMRPSSSVRN